jgi:hypothetical protein
MKTEMFIPFVIKVEYISHRIKIPFQRYFKCILKYLGLTFKFLRVVQLAVHSASSRNLLTLRDQGPGLSGGNRTFAPRPPQNRHRIHRFSWNVRLSKITKCLCLFLVIIIEREGSRDSAVGIATGYGLDDRGIGVLVPLGSRIVFTSSSPALGPTQSPIQWVPGGSFPRGKAAGAWSWPLTSN